MQIDSKLEFVPHTGAPQTVVGAAGATITFTGIIDLLGEGVGTAPGSIIGNATLFGDPGEGIGRTKPDIQISIGTAFTTSNAATANFAIQYAPDSGTPTYLPGTWETAAETGAKPVSECTANQVFRLAVPPAPPNTQRPRYMQLVVLIPAATAMTAGTVSWAGIVFARDDLAVRQGAKNFTVA
jgi:hypothetical protein